MPDPHPTQPRLCVIGESDPFLARLLQRFAEKSGLKVTSARTGEDVLALAQHHRPALIILEPELPGKLRGWDVIRQLREDSQEIPVIVCAWRKKDETLALTGPVAAYLQKPDLHYEDFVTALAAANVTSW